MRHACNRGRFRQRFGNRQLMTIEHHRTVAGLQTAQVKVKAGAMIQMQEDRHRRFGG